MNLSGKRIAILGGTRISCEIVLAAKALGMHTTVIDYYPPEKSPAKQVADSHTLISVADAEAVAGFARDNGIDGILTGYTDSILGMYADACEAAGLPCYGTRAQFETFTDKRRWKELCRLHGVPTAAEHDESLLDLPEEEIGFPLFVKPADGSGSRGVSVVRSKRELAEAVDKARAYAKNGQVVIEDYLEGPEVTVFWLFVDGRHEVFLVGDRFVKCSQDGTVPLPVGYAFPSAVVPRYLEEVAPKVREMLSAAGIRDGMMFMQCIVKDGLPHVYDIGYRLTGSLEHHLTKAVAGYSPLDMLLHYAVTGRMTDDPTIWDRVRSGMEAPCYNVSFLMKPGTLGRFEGLERLELIEGVVASRKAHVEGETLPPEAKGELRQIALRVLGCADRPSKLEESMLEVQRSVRIVSPDGEDLTLPGLCSEDFEALTMEH